MIKFFRQIRQRLLSEGKTTKYLKYAIGEIVLVVIGILIALQINNWNEIRKANKKSRNYLIEIKSDLKTDTIRFNRAIKLLNNMIADEKWVLNATDYTYKDVDRLWECISGWYMPFNINTRTFREMQNEGNSKLVGFDKLSEKINDYYIRIDNMTKERTAYDRQDVNERRAWLSDLEKTIEISNHRMQTFGGGKVTKNFPMRQDSITNIELVIAFANSTRGRNHFKHNYIRHMILVDWYKDVVSKAKNLIKEIEKELQN
ncbi:DUF6090 family protein [Aestuariivivens sediminis]|uniref:DUF6090 family protein n=1 Tax=Aestuariivivens sediminis TaxID=2913557 RepID=UPI001F57C1CB|nr:DUF6090 family protein [Aestuariivivens sediminis]